MKKQNLNKGKKLNKKELRSVTGGLMRCLDPATGLCTSIGLGCFERQCRIIIDPPIE